MSFDGDKKIPPRSNYSTGSFKSSRLTTRIKNFLTPRSSIANKSPENSIVLESDGSYDSEVEELTANLAANSPFHSRSGTQDSQITVTDCSGPNAESYSSANILIECDDYKSDLHDEPVGLKLEDLKWLNQDNSSKSSTSDNNSITTPNVDNLFVENFVCDENGCVNICEQDKASNVFSKKSDYQGTPTDELELVLDYVQKKRNIEFHNNFPSLPQGDLYLEDWHCALQKEIMISGRLYVTQERIFFHSNLFGWVNYTNIPFSDIVMIEKRSTALVIPNAIRIVTLDHKYFFTSFISRDSAFNFLYDLWHKKCPNRAVDPSKSCNQTEIKDNNASNDPLQDSGINTLCSCLKNSGHAGIINIDTVYSTSIETLFNLLFGNDDTFIRNHYSKSNQNVNIEEWKDKTIRKISYIKPLSNSLGPKQTLCDITEEVIFNDIEDYCTIEVKTQNPDVPSGDAFTVISRTCLMRQRTNQCRLITSTSIEWSKSSWIKGPIESGAKDGTTKAAQDLDSAIRQHLDSHPELLTEPIGSEESPEESENNECCESQNSNLSEGSFVFLRYTLNKKLFLGAVLILFGAICSGFWAKLKYNFKTENMSTELNNFQPQASLKDNFNKLKVTEQDKTVFNPKLMKKHNLAHLQALKAAIKAIEIQLRSVESEVSKLELE